jgi:hypothetical protein
MGGKESAGQPQREVIAVHSATPYLPFRAYALGLTHSSGQETTYCYDIDTVWAL